MRNETRRPCPACLGSDAKYCGPKNGFEIFVCSNCSTIYTANLPAGDEIEDYDAYYTDANLAVPAFLSERVREIIAGFEPYRETGRLLDVGFGSGTILDEAKNQNWDSYGTEVSRPAYEQAVRSGHRVYHGSLRDAAFEDGFFDVITASEIIEHLPDPYEELLEIARILRPGGLFWATTPSARSLSFRLMKQSWSIVSPPEHTQLYSKAGAELILRKAGFTSIRVVTSALNPAEIVNHYRTKGTASSTFNRVGTGYELNEKLTSSPLRKKIKSGLNAVLNLFQLGDSLRIFAQKGTRAKK